MGGTFGYDTGNVSITSIVLLGSGSGGTNTTTNSTLSQKEETVSRAVPLTKGYSVKLA